MSSNQSKSPVQEFEYEIRQVVRRGSKSNEFDSAIQEITSHFADLVTEEMDQGKTQSDAIKIAENRLGSPLKIGLQILNSPSRKLKGSRLQVLGLSGLTLFAVMTMVFVKLSLDLHNNLMSASYFLILGLLLTSAHIFGRGVLLSEKANWRLTISAFVSFFGITLISLKFFVPKFIPNSNRAQFSSADYPLLFLIEAAQWTILAGTIFLSVALLSFQIGRIWLLRATWFQLSRK